MESANAVLAHSSAEISRIILQHSTRRLQLLFPDRPITVAGEHVAIRDQWRIDLRDPILRDIIKSHSASNGRGSERLHKTSWFLRDYEPERFHRGAECNESRGQQPRSFNGNSADH